MAFIDWLLGTPLGKILYFCYQIIGNYGLAIIAFALAVKIVLFPLSMLAQHNAIIMASLRPKIDDIKRRYEGNNSLILEEQNKLYKQNHYSALKGSLPMLVQIPVILGVISVVYHPLKHVLGLPAQAIAALNARAAAILGMTPETLGYAAETRVIDLVQQNPAQFAGQAPPEVVEQIQGMHMSFLGLNLGEIPSWTSLSILWPILSALSALALCLYQNRYYVLQKFAGRASRWGITIFMVLFSGYFALVLPGAFGLYWTAGNLLSILVVWLCNVIEDPRKKVDYSRITAKPRLTREERSTKAEEKKEAAAKSRADVKRFRKTPGKSVMFYSEGSGYWKYFAGVIEELTSQGTTVHYVTSDIHDRVFDRASERLVPYFVGNRALIPFMMQLDVDIVVMTTPDLEKYHIKRSLVRKDIEYIYMDHGMTSLHLMLREGALDAFDTIFCNGPNHVEEMRQTEEEYGLPAKRLVPVGYPLFDDMVTARGEQGTRPDNDPPLILLAPSWQPENLLELCAVETVRPLIDAGFHVVIRPHPEFVKRFPDQVSALRTAFHDDIEEGTCELQTDFSSNSTVYNSDVIVTDWSTIAQEFSYATHRPSIFVNTPMKIMNPNWEAIDAVPLDISLRDRIGVSLDIDELPKIADIARRMIVERASWRDRIDTVVNECLFNIGHSADAAAKYIRSQLEVRSLEAAVAQAQAASDAGEATEEQEAVLKGAASRLEREQIDELRVRAAEMELMAQSLRVQADDLENGSLKEEAYA